MTRVKTEQLDNEEGTPASAAAAAAADKTSDNNDNISQDGQLPAKKLCTSLSADGVCLSSTSGAEYNIKHEKKTQEILDLSRITAADDDDDDADDSADGIRYLSLYLYRNQYQYHQRLAVTLDQSDC